MTQQNLDRGKSHIDGDIEFRGIIGKSKFTKSPRIYKIQEWRRIQATFDSIDFKHSFVFLNNISGNLFQESSHSSRFLAQNTTERSFEGSVNDKIVQLSITFKNGGSAQLALPPFLHHMLWSSSFAFSNAIDLRCIHFGEQFVMHCLI